MLSSINKISDKPLSVGIANSQKYLNGYCQSQ